MNKVYLIIVSAIIISANVFSFLNIQTTMFGRRLHMLSTSWAFVLMVIHIGLHLNSIMSKISNKMKNNTFEYIYYFMLVLISIFGLYSFVNLELWKDMFLLNDFKFWDYTQNTIMFFLKFIGILISIALIIYFGLMLIKKINKKKE